LIFAVALGKMPEILPGALCSANRQNSPWRLKSVRHMETTKEGIGLVRFGQVKTFGKWEVSEGQLRISFDVNVLSRDALRDLSIYQSSSKPLPVKLPVEHKPKDRVVLGYERKQGTATFYLQ
jgi:hypothetical protein